MQYRHFIFIGLLLLTLQACLYRLDIPQGNRIEQQKLSQLKTGMTRTQVEFLLGRSAINDMYHANQSHYVYYLFDGEERTTELKTMILSYDDRDILIDIKGSL